MSDVHAIGPEHSVPPAMIARAATLAGGGAWRCELAGERLGWTHGVYGLFGIDPGVRVERPEIVGLYEDESRETMERVRSAAILSGSAFTFDAAIRAVTGERRWMRVWGEVESRDGRAVALNGFKQDVTRQRAELEQLRARAERDPLTGLGNRATFEARFLDLPDPASAGIGALVLLDLDGFKQVNDRYGHDAGDACLRSFAMRLWDTLGDAALIARLGGDEFAALLPHGPMLPRARLIARVIPLLASPVAWQGKLVHFGVSAGIAAAQGSPESCFAAADAALYAAKRAGRNQVRIASAGPAAAPPHFASVPARETLYARHGNTHRK
ncbi:GGDEF domain-containing protein [Sphingomonas baiyangensis]|uniref:GGDEF domain-containing protein n=1 Tax=Sphingomonas baiyangensis TaxID=2572576 RepID=A0A4U1L5G8_9SPHN|nr:GGDEF domain-containing protein [Sphingomonas baiyangensis]TKD51510.1 GGDEF domain-containing protein [Sphingomonas baiyangensis]